MSYKIAINCLKASIVALFLLVFQPLFAQKDIPALTQFLEQQKKDFGNDFAVVLAGTDSTLYQKEFGDIKHKTVAPIAGSSSWLTAALVMQFVDEGKLSLDDKVAQYLPVFEKYGKNYITIRHCLLHQTGIQDRKGKISRLMERKKYSTLDERVADFASKEIQTNPGTAYSYSDMGLNIAGRVLEVASKKRFDLLIKQKLLTPLGMRQTTFSTTDGSAPDAAAGAHSTATDYMAFLKMLLLNGKHNGQQILSESAIAQLRALQTPALPMHEVPQEVTGAQFVLGAWAFENKGSSATVLSSPGFSGTWPVVDYCRGYAFLLLPKNGLDEGKGELYAGLKKLIDPNFTNGCR